jgi:hypothetical protein
MLGITVSQLEAMGADARVTEFKGIVGTESVAKATEQKTSESNTARQSLENIQSKLKGDLPKARINPITGKPIL